MRTESRYREGLKELIATMPLEEITVQVLCDKVGSARQTFYYHYRYIYDVVNSIILEEKIDRSNEIKIQSIIKNTLVYVNKNYQLLYAFLNSFAKDLVEELFYSHFYHKIGDNLKKSKIENANDINRYLSNVFSKEVCYFIATKRREKVASFTKRMMVIWGLFTVDYPVEIED